MNKIVSYIAVIAGLFFFSTNASAQKYSVQGQLINVNKSPVEFVDVTLLDNDSTFITSAPTDSIGHFLINASKGDYILQFRQFGNLLLYKPILLNKDTNLGEIVINEAIQLDELMVFGKKKVIERKVDRLVFSVEDVVSLGGGNALDALEKTPRVKVLNDNISMVGKSNMLVMVDDRIVQLSGADLTNYLKSINSDDIKSIEVITNPPAKYVADGNSGIINILTKSHQKEALWSAALRTSYKQSSYATGSYGGNLNFQNTKWQLNSSLDYIDGANKGKGNSNIYYLNETWQNRATWKANTDKLSAQLGASYNINTKLSTGFAYNYISNDPKLRRKEKVDIVENKRFINTEDNTSFDKNIHSFNYNFVYRPDSLGKRLILDIDFFNYKNRSNQEYLSRTIEHTGQMSSAAKGDNYTNQRIKNYSFNLDMEHPTKWVNLNYGARYSQTNTRNLLEIAEHTNHVSSNNEQFDLKDNFEYRERTQSLYLSGQREFSDKWEAKLGVRFEATQTRGVSTAENQTNKNNYAKLFPTLYIAYTINDNHSLNLNYGKRISRPGFSLLNPFRWSSNPYAYNQGNPDLRPAFINNIEIEYSYKNNFITNLYYSHTSDLFDYITILDTDTKIEKITPLNFQTTQLIGVSQTVMVSPFHWWDLYINMDVYYSYAKSKISITEPQLSGWNGSMSISNDFALRKKKDLFFNISAEYATKGVDGMDRMSSFGELTAALKWKTLKEKLIITLSAYDIFDTYHAKVTSYSNGIKAEYKNYYDRRSVRLSVSYNFGKKITPKRNSSKNIQEYSRLEY